MCVCVCVCVTLHFSLQVFDLLMNGSDLVNKLQTNTKYFRSVLKDAGFSLKVIIYLKILQLFH